MTVAFSPMFTLDVALTPRLYSLYAHPDSVVVVIDILRATTAICTAFENGVEKMIPVATLEEAWAYREKGYLLGAERNGEKIEGADFGNSPYDYMGDHLKGKTTVITTTNGTRAIEMSKDSHQVIIGSFVNIDVVVNHLIQSKRNVVLLCAGWKEKFNLEDTMFAGALVDRLAEHEQFADVSDAALIARYLYANAMEDPYHFLKNSSHRKRMQKLNLKEDIRYSLNPERSEIIPVLKNGALVQLSR
ncbi:MAG: 2-phosphosulfolactate phosphatase [Salibacteraceae bacterium]